MMTVLSVGYPLMPVGPDLAEALNKSCHCWSAAWLMRGANR